MMHYAIAQNIIGSTKEVPLSQADFEQAQRSYDILQLVVAVEEGFDAIARNFLDFELDMITSVLEVSHVGFGAGMKGMAIRRLLNRRMSNLLSATRAYTDTTKHAAKLIFGQDERYKAVDERFNHHYDSCLGYRVLEALRNYSQHCGLPIHEVRYSTKVLREKVGKPMKHTIAPLLDVGILKSDSQFKASVLKELEAKGQHINLKSFTREYVACLAEIHELFRNHVANVSKSENEVIERLASAFIDVKATKDGRAGLYAVELNGSKWVRRVPLFAGLYDYGEFLVHSNLHFVHVGVSFVSSELEEDA